MFKNLLAED